MELKSIFQFFLQYNFNKNVHTKVMKSLGHARNDEMHVIYLRL
jgi:hypothetical protein